MEINRSAFRVPAMAVRSSRGIKRSPASSEDHLAARSLFDQLFELPGNGEIYVLFNAPSRTCGPGVFASMPGVQDDTRDTEAQLLRQRRHIIAGNGRRRRRDPLSVPVRVDGPERRSPRGRDRPWKRPGRPGRTGRREQPAPGRAPPVSH